LFGTLARVDEQKGLRELVLAIAALPIEYKQKVKLWLIGDRAIESVLPDGRKLYEKSSEELYHWIQQYIQENALEQCIQMIPFQREYIRYVDAMDVFVLASWNEMYSLSVIDAMLMEKPIIGTHAGGTTEQIGIQERGILAEPKSVESLQKAILFMINNPEQRKEMAQNAKEWAIEEHTWPLVIDRWKSLYQETI
jgi:glycosyltransferase involved in cell wall biosynthesis